MKYKNKKLNRIYDMRQLFLIMLTYSNGDILRSYDAMNGTPMMNVNTIVVGRKLSSQSGSSQLSIDNHNRSFSQNSSRRGSLMKVP